MIKVYGIPNCNTVQKVIAWLKEHKVPYEFHDYKQKGITATKLKQWTKHFGWENVVNKAGTTWKELSDDEKATITNEAAAVKLMKEHTSAIRRPIVETGNDYLIRFNEEEYKIKLLKK